MAFDLDNEELRATRKLHKINDDLYEETSDKKFKNDRVIAHKFAVMQQQINEKDSRIQELEEELEKANRQLDLDYVDDNYIQEQEAIERLSKLVELRKNKTGEIIFDNCLCSTDDLETVIFMLREQDVPTGRAKKKKEKRNRKNSQR